MLTPSQLESIPNNIVDLFSQLEEFVILDFSRRLKKTATITSSAEWQKNQAELYGIRNIEAKIAATLNLSYSQIESLFPQIAAVSIAAESEIYKAAGLKTIRLNESQALKDYLASAIKNTKGDIENITQSMGFAENVNGHVVYKPIAKFYQEQLNIAQLKVQSGVSDYNLAIKQAVKKMTDSGLRYVDYESNWSNQIDVATRRAVLTSTHQMNQQMIDFNMNKIIEDKNEQYVEVTAHAGARTGVGVGNHQAWQGKVYKVNGSDKDYPNLVESTGLGMGAGLEGYNCRHSYAVFIPQASIRTYTDEQLKNIDPPNFDYKGKNYTCYEATQYQRKIETAMRATKRSIIAYKESGLDAEFKASSIKLQQQRAEYKQFSNAANIRPKNERATVQGFDRSISQQATNAAKK